MTKKIINVKIFKCITTRVYIIRAQITLLRSNEMKKLLSFLLSMLLVSTLVFSVTACKKNEEGVVLDETVTPITIKIETELDEDDNEQKVLTEITLSASAKDYVDKRNFTGLKNLLAKHATSDAKWFTVDAENEKVTFEIPSNVTVIASNSVVNLSFITEIIVNDNVTEIEQGAFVGLSGLETITLPFVGGKIGAVNDGKLFAYIFGSIGTDGLTAVTQNYNEGTSSTASLYVPTSLKTVNVTGDVKSTPATETYYVNEDNEHVKLAEGETAPEGATVITVAVESYKESAVQPYAFYGITTVETVNFLGEIEAIPDYTFYGCSALKILEIKETITTIGKYAYAGCSSLRELTLNNVEVIREGAFSNCSSLAKSTEIKAGSLDISGVITIEEGAFVGCSSLNKNKLILGSHTAEELEDAFNEDFFATEEENV